VASATGLLVLYTLNTNGRFAREQLAFLPDFGKGE
jgi:hypothetical protein